MFQARQIFRKHMEEMPILFLAIMDVGQNHMDFLKADKKKKDRTIGKMMSAVPGSREGAAMLFCMLLLFAAIRTGNEKSRKELLELRAIFEQEENQMQYYAELEREKQIEQLTNGMEELYFVNRMLDLKEPDGSLLEEIEEIAGAESRFDYQYSKKEQMLHFSCVTDDYRNIPDYMDKLEKLSAFEEVRYKGYRRKGRA